MPRKFTPTPAPGSWKGLILMAAAALFIGLTSRSLQVLAGWERYPAETARAVEAAIGQILPEVESFIKANKLSGQSAKVRSGALRQDLTHVQTDPFGGHVGTTARTAAYARTVAGKGTTTITPKKSKHLWIPAGDNLTPSGQTRISPSAAFELKGPRGGNLLSIFTSRAGNLVAVLRSAIGKRRGARGKASGGKLLFVLKKSVTVRGTDAVGRAGEDIRPRGLELLGIAVSSLDTSGGGASGGGGIA